MGRVILRPTVPSDLCTVIGEALPFRIKALTVEADGRVLGVGGIGFPPNGPVIAFVQAAPDAHKYPVSFHRAGLAAMKMIRESGVAEVIAQAHDDDPTAIRWLLRLGFEETNIGEMRIFKWRR